MYRCEQDLPMLSEPSGDRNNDPGLEAIQS